MSEMTVERAAEILAEHEYGGYSAWAREGLFVAGTKPPKGFPRLHLYRDDAIAIAEGLLAKIENSRLRDVLAGVTAANYRLLDGKTIAEAEVERLDAECNQRAKETEQVEQILGEALGFWHYDPETQPGSDPTLVDVREWTAIDLAELLVEVQQGE